MHTVPVVHRLRLTWKGGRVVSATCRCGWVSGRPVTVAEARRRFDVHVPPPPASAA